MRIRDIFAIAVVSSAIGFITGFFAMMAVLSQ
jgi:hypothetical protein